MPFEELQELSPWVGNATSNFYSIYTYFESQTNGSDPTPFNSPDEVIELIPPQAFMEIVEVNGFSDLPAILRIDPYGRVPDSSPSKIQEEDYNFR